MSAVAPHLNKSSQPGWNEHGCTLDRACVGNEVFVALRVYVFVRKHISLH